MIAEIDWAGLKDFVLFLAVAIVPMILAAWRKSELKRKEEERASDAMHDAIQEADENGGDAKSHLAVKKAADPALAKHLDAKATKRLAKKEISDA